MAAIIRLVFMCFEVCKKKTNREQVFCKLLNTHPAVTPVTGQISPNQNLETTISK